jgi:hypothetical protein
VARRLTLLAAVDTDLAAQLMLPFAQPHGEDEEPTAELGAPGLTDAAEERRQLERLLALARRASTRESKLARLQRLLRCAGEPAIVFTEYRDTLERIASALNDDTIAVLHGGMPAADRRDAERRFTSGRARILLATDAASEGLNLHHRCRLIVNLELPWTPLRLEQRVGRVDRIGQTRPVHAVHFVARDTPEEQVIERLIRRERHAHAALDAIARIDPQTIAAIAIDGQPPPPIAEPTHAPGVTADLRNDAIDECRRLSQVRALAAADAVESTRPVVTGSRRRSGRAVVCAWTLSLVTADEEWLWHTMLATESSGHHQHGSSPALVRAALEESLVDAAAAANHAADRVVARFHDSMRHRVGRALARELAIADAIIRVRATMAVSVMQRGLFEHAHDRGDTRSATFDAALRRCDARIAALTSVATARADAPRLAFAVVFGR